MQASAAELGKHIRKYFTHYASFTIAVFGLMVLSRVEQSVKNFKRQKTNAPVNASTASISTYGISEEVSKNKRFFAYYDNA